MARILSLFLGVIFGCAFAQQTELHNFVNPFIGTGGHGHTYPGVAAPFGMIQLSPDTRLDGWDGCGGYHYSDSIIYGFSHTHLSGTGVPDYADLLLMPFTGESKWNNGYDGKEEGYGSSFKHSNEFANAGSYSVLLNDDQIQVDLASTVRCGIHQYTYPKWQKKKVIIDLEHRDMLLDTDLILLNDSTLIGKRISKAWAQEQHFYFTIQFSEAAIKTELRKNKSGKPSKMVLEFSHINPILKVKVGISAVDIDGAKKNLQAEMQHWDLPTYRKDCQNLWDKELGKIEVTSDNKEDIEIFYTALYHAYLNPNEFSDVDGKYRGMDQKIHTSNSHKQYSVFSLWDTFRACHPLFTITQQKRTDDFIGTFLTQYRQGGILPIWELSANYTGCMIGYHAIPVIVDAYVKGLRNFDTDLALKAMLYSAEQNHLGLEAYKSRGYISSEDESESVSKTLEYAYDDWCIAVFADSLGKDSIAAVYYKRGQYYKNMFNTTSKFMQPRYNGGWKNGFKPEEVTFDYTEANSWQYSLFVPQDVNGLTAMLGGKDELENWLDRLFSASSSTSGRDQVDITGLIGQYAHGNEPSHHMAYLYNFTKSPWKTQEYVHQILKTLYTTNPDGLSGNEDCGQMSAWYILSSLGFYSFTPGSDVYLTGTPLFDAQINLENGKTFEIKRKNAGEDNIYVSSMVLNGKKIDRNFIYHHEILDGGTIVFEMSDKPAKATENYPSSAITKNHLVASPIFTNGSPSFEKKRKIGLGSNTNEAVVIRYTTDGTVPTVKSKMYKKPFKIKASTVVQASSFNATQSASFPIEGKFNRVDSNWDIKLKSSYENQYSAGGDRALIDKITGGKDFRTGAWQGYLGQDVTLEIDFKKKIKINEVQMRFLQDIKSWIWFPSEVSFLISEDGENWYTVATDKNKEPIDQYGSYDTSLGFKKELKTRYLKVIAKNRGLCPEWHLGAGNTTWVFADEIIIK